MESYKKKKRKVVIEKIRVRGPAAAATSVVVSVSRCVKWGKILYDYIEFDP